MTRRLGVEGARALGPVLPRPPRAGGTSGGQSSSSGARSSASLSLWYRRQILSTSLSFPPGLVGAASSSSLTSPPSASRPSPSTSSPPSTPSCSPSSSPPRISTAVPPFAGVPAVPLRRSTSDCLATE